MVIRKIMGRLRTAKATEELVRLLSGLGTGKLRSECPSANLYLALN
jgi:hypothetical protein